jgi:hypothetical protein
MNGVMTSACHARFLFDRRIGALGFEIFEFNGATTVEIVPSESRHAMPCHLHNNC